MWNGFVHGEGTGWQGPGRARARLLARVVEARHQDVHRDRRPARAGGRADAVRDLGLRRRLLVRPHEEPLPGRAARASTPSSSAPCSRSTSGRSSTAGRARASPELDRSVRDGHRRSRLPRPADAPDRATASAPAPTSRPMHIRRAAGRSRRDGARDRAGDLLGGRRRPARRGQLPRSPRTGSRSSRRSRTGWCAR